MKYKIKISSKNQIFIINGRSVRSPLEAIVDESSLKSLRAALKHYGLKESACGIIPLIDNKMDYSRIPVKKEVKVLITKPIITEKIKTIPVSFSVEQKNLCLDLDKKIEQNINVETDTEVRIEELSNKSSSILSKFLNSEF